MSTPSDTFQLLLSTVSGITCIPRWQYPTQQLNDQHQDWIAFHVSAYNPRYGPVITHQGFPTETDTMTWFYTAEVAISVYGPNAEANFETLQGKLPLPQFYSGNLSFVEVATGTVNPELFNQVYYYKIDTIAKFRVAINTVVPQGDITSTPFHIN